MRQQIRRTGDHGIGRMVHVIHVSDDAQELREFYERVFGAFVYMGVDEPTYLASEDRYATLLMIGDLCIETMAPKLPVDPLFSIGRFYAKFGRHLHSVGFQVEDLGGLTERLLERDIAISRPGGGRLEKVDPEAAYLFPSPRDTAGLLVEFTAHDMHDDPRDRETWSSLERMWQTHPSTIDGFSSVILGVRDLEAAVATYVDSVQAVVLDAGSDPALQTSHRTLQIGDCLLEIAEPQSEGSDIGRHVVRWGNMIYGLRFRVRDVDSAERWLQTCGVRTTRIHDGLLVTDVEDTFGAPIYLGTAEPARHGKP
jgi:catechol 2,3-dioxygenase-like lactoylglutathione lyase family enzyme